MKGGGPPPCAPLAATTADRLGPGTWLRRRPPLVRLRRLREGPPARPLGLVALPRLVHPRPSNTATLPYDQFVVEQLRRRPAADAHRRSRRWRPAFHRNTLTNKEVGHPYQEQFPRRAVVDPGQHHGPRCPRRPRWAAAVPRPQVSTRSASAKLLPASSPFSHSDPGGGLDRPLCGRRGESTQKAKT